MPSNQDHKPKRPKKARSSEAPVSSRGCSRAFIICVLEQMLDYVRSLSHSPDGYSDALVMSWFLEANRRCREGRIVQNLGGTEFCASDPATYWTDPHQFLPTWWKNNIERKSKFENLQRDAETYTSNEKSRQRAFYCTYVIVLATNIRNHFEKNRVLCGNGALPGPQAAVPIWEDFCRGGSVGGNGGGNGTSFRGGPYPPQHSYNTYGPGTYAYMGGSSSGGAPGGGRSSGYLPPGYSQYPPHYPPDGSTETDHWPDNTSSVHLCSRSACTPSPPPHFPVIPPTGQYGGMQPPHCSDRYDDSHGNVFRKAYTSFAYNGMTREQKELFDSMMRGEGLHAQPPINYHAPSPSCEYCVHGGCRAQAQTQSGVPHFRTSPNISHPLRSYSPPSSHAYHSHSHGSHHSPPPVDHHDPYGSPRGVDGSYPPVKQEENYAAYHDRDQQQYQQQYHHHYHQSGPQRHRQEQHFQPACDGGGYATATSYYPQPEPGDDNDSCCSSATACGTVMGDRQCDGASRSGNRTGLMGGGNSEPSSELNCRAGEYYGDINGEFGLPFDGLHSDESDDDNDGVTVEDAFSAIANMVDFGMGDDNDGDDQAAASLSASDPVIPSRRSLSIRDNGDEGEGCSDETVAKGEGTNSSRDGHAWRRFSPSCERMGSDGSGHCVVDELMEGPLLVTTFSSIAQHVPEHFTSSADTSSMATIGGRSLSKESDDHVVMRKPKATCTSPRTFHGPKCIPRGCEVSEADSLPVSGTYSRDTAFRLTQHPPMRSPSKSPPPSTFNSWEVTAMSASSPTRTAASSSKDTMRDVHKKNRRSPVKLNQLLPPFGMKAYGSVPDIHTMASSSRHTLDCDESDVSSSSDEEIDEEEEGLLCQSLSYEELTTSPLLVHSPRVKHAKKLELSLSVSRNSSNSPSLSSACSASDDNSPVHAAAACHRSGHRVGKKSPSGTDVKGRGNMCRGALQQQRQEREMDRDASMSAYARVRSPKTQPGSVHFNFEDPEEKAHHEDHRPLKKYCSMTHTECMSPSTIDGFTLLDLSPRSSFSSYSSRPNSQPVSPSAPCNSPPSPSSPSCTLATESPDATVTRTSPLDRSFAATTSADNEGKAEGVHPSMLRDTMPDCCNMRSSPDQTARYSGSSFDRDSKGSLWGEETLDLFVESKGNYRTGPGIYDGDGSLAFMNHMLDDVIVAVEEI